MAAAFPLESEAAAWFAAAPAALVSLNPDGIVASANDAACRLLGRPRHAIEGQAWYDCFPASDVAPTRAGIERLLAAPDDADLPRAWTVRVSTGDETLRSIRLTGAPCRLDGRPHVVFALEARDEPIPDVEAARANAMLVEQSAVGMALTDLHGRWLRINGAYAAMLGYSVDELMNIGFADITHPDDRATDEAAIARLKSGDVTSYSLDKRYIRRDGTMLWVRVHVNGVYDDGTLACWAAQVVDIDAEHRALAETRGLQIQLQSFIDHVPANIAMKDRDGRYTLVNEMFAASLDREPASLIGNTLAELDIGHHAVIEALEDEAVVIKTGAVVEREVPDLTRPDVSMWASRFPILGTDGSIAGTGLFSTDISQMKRNETELLAQARTIGLLQRVAVAANEASNANAAMRECLQLLCQYMEWPYGHVCVPDEANASLVSTGICCGPADGPDRVVLEEAFAGYERSGADGVANRAWVARGPCDESRRDDLLPLADAGIRDAAAFPVLLNGDVVAIFEFFAREPISFDDTTGEVLAFVAVQVGYAIHREMAERKTARALEQLSYHIDNSPVGVVTVDSDFRIADWSPKSEEIFGWSESEVLGKTVDELGFIHPDDRHLVTNAFTELSDPDVTRYRLFHRNLTKSGDVVHIDWYNSVMRDDAGAVVSNLGIAVDRTVEVEARRALEEERQIFVSGPTIVMRWRDDPGWPIEYASPNVEAIAGYKAEEFSSGEVRLADLIHPDHIDELTRGAKNLSGGTTRQWTPEPYRLVTKSGEVIWLQTYVSSLPRTDGIGRYIAYSVDVSRMIELQAETAWHEQRLRNVIAATDVGTWEWDVASGALRFNARMADMLGFTLDELQPLMFDLWERLVHPDDHPRTIDALQRNLAGETENTVVDYRLRRKDGTWVWVLMRGNVVDRDADGTPLRLAGIHLDISDQKAAEATILETNEALKRSNVELERFAYVASHDLQEPLRMVASFTQLLKTKYGDQLDETAREYIHFAFDGAQRMQQLIRDLLSYSRLGRQEIEELPVDLAALVARVRQSLQLAIEEADAKIECGNLPIVRGDTAQLYQLLQNLIGNAIKYRGDRRPYVGITTEVRDGETVFCVRDNGIGIEPAQSARVFEIFQRLHSRGEYPGTGIGLSVCKRIVERHDGRIWFEPAEGGGTVFCFTLAADRYTAA